MKHAELGNWHNPRIFAYESSRYFMAGVVDWCTRMEIGKSPLGLARCRCRCCIGLHCGSKCLAGFGRGHSLRTNSRHVPDTHDGLNISSFPALMLLKRTNRLTVLAEVHHWIRRSRQFHSTIRFPTSQGRTLRVPLSSPRLIGVAESRGTRG